MEASHFIALPSDLKRAIALFIEPNHLIHLLLTCHQLHEEIDNEIYWKMMFQRNFSPFQFRVEPLKEDEQESILYDQMSWKTKFRLQWWIPKWRKEKLKENMFVDEHQTSCWIKSWSENEDCEFVCNDSFYTPGIYFAEFEIRRGKYHILLGVSNHSSHLHFSSNSEIFSSSGSQRVRYRKWVTGDRIGIAFEYIQSKKQDRETNEIILELFINRKLAHVTIDSFPPLSQHHPMRFSAILYSKEESITIVDGRRPCSHLIQQMNHPPPVAEGFSLSQVWGKIKSILL
eukprot:TRINITY_DN7092_c0_g1_i1.p1 TRINITY_DN7092_c0_g1~~TRINITY_DN7092_c0_g1_i1.p1  ORF type:complete len:287 (-),score=67.44 TRINITY_DN7092_c0_g1_i1:73-933(-)